MDSFICKVAVCMLSRKLHHKIFSMTFEKFFRTAIIKSICEQVPSFQYSLRAFIY